MRLRVYVYETERPIGQLCLWMLQKKKVKMVSDPKKADVAFAPCLERKLTREELEAPKHGTLILHPSLLPRHRGKDAIKWAFVFGERYTGATWFWADENYDTGDICEMEVLAIHPKESPREFYASTVMSSAMRMLHFIIDDLSQGIVRRRPQNHDHATFEPAFQSGKEEC